MVSATNHKLQARNDLLLYGVMLGCLPQITNYKQGMSCYCNGVMLECLPCDVRVSATNHKLQARNELLL